MNRPIRLFATLVLVALAACSSASPQPAPPANEPPVSEPPAVDPPANEAAACTTDADCRLVADYCTGCDCRVLAKADPDPTCKGPGVKCFADPCMRQTAACDAGKCVSRAATP